MYHVSRVSQLTSPLLLRSVTIAIKFQVIGARVPAILHRLLRSTKVSIGKLKSFNG